MGISPLDIRRKNFFTKFRGYDKEAVKEFLEIIAKDLENLLKERQELQEKVLSLEEKLAGYIRTEKLLKDTLMTTQNVVNDLKANAQKEAENIVAKANIEANEIIAKAKRDVERLTIQKDLLLANLKGLIEGITNFLNEWQKNYEKKD